MHASVERNDTLQECSYNAKSSRDDDLWIKAKERKTNKERKTQNKKQTNRVLNTSNNHQRNWCEVLDSDGKDASDEITITTSNVKPSNLIIKRDKIGIDKETTSIRILSTVNKDQRVDMKDLNEFLSEFLAEEKSELREINSICSKISTTLSAQHQEELEQTNLRL